MIHTETKADQIAAINTEILRLQQLLKDDLSAINEPVLKEIISLLNQRSEVENG